MFDLETQRAFDEVPDRRPDLLGLSVAVVFSYDTGRFDHYREAQAAGLAERLLAARLVVGFNHRRFDLAVLAPYGPPGLEGRVATLDLMQDLEERVGHRVGLDATCRLTLGESKRGHGLLAIDWYRQGRFDLLERYCESDVRLTRELFDHGRVAGWVTVEGRSEVGLTSPRVVQVSWSAEGLALPGRLQALP